MSKRRDIPGSRIEWNGRHTIDDSDVIYLRDNYILMDLLLITRQDGKLREDIRIAQIGTIKLELQKNLILDYHSELAVLEIK